MSNPRYISALLIPVLTLCSMYATTTSVLPMSLQRITATAEVIFHDKAVSNEVRLDPQSGRVATFTTFEVIEVVKGNVDATHTIKQIGGQLPGSSVRQVFHGVPRFRSGHEYVVFLPKASSLGFASPIGLTQGKFDVYKLNGQSVVKQRPGGSAQTGIPTQQKLSKVPSGVALGNTPGPGASPDSTQSIGLPEFLQTVHGLINE